MAPTNIPPDDKMPGISLVGLVTKPKKGSTYFSVLVGSVTGSAASTLLAWATATGIGFTTSGIAAGSITAGMMSATAIANFRRKPLRP